MSTRTWTHTDTYTHLLLFIAAQSFLLWHSVVFKIWVHIFSSFSADSQNFTEFFVNPAAYFYLFRVQSSTLTHYCNTLNLTEHRHLFFKAWNFSTSLAQTLELRIPFTINLDQETRLHSLHTAWITFFNIPFSSERPCFLLSLHNESVWWEEKMFAEFCVKNLYSSCQPLIGFL